jgi:protein-L-isoaspartate(D-aspartate) O-methyltransferase
VTTTEDREGFAAFLLRARASGLSDRNLIAAIEATPRRSFVPAQWQADCWSKGMLPIECGEAIEGIDLQASALASLDIQPGHKVLEIGTGSGFTAAVMGRLSGRVLSVERFKTLVEGARQRLEALQITNVLVRQADGRDGAAADGPFDRIIAWAAYPELPRQLADQLSTGGVMIAPLGRPEEPQALARLAKVGSRFERLDLARVRLQPIAEGLSQAI